MPDLDEEQRLRERLMKRKLERQAAGGSKAGGDGDGGPEPESSSNKKHRRSNDSAEAATPTEESTSPPKQPQQADDREMPKKKTDEEKINIDSSPNNNNNQNNDETSKHSNRGERGSFDHRADSSVKIKNDDDDRHRPGSGSSGRRERRHEHRSVSSRDGRGGGSGPHGYDRHYGRHPPPSGRWERDRYGGRGRGGPRDRYNDNRRGPPPHPGYYRSGHRDRLPQGRRQRRGGRSTSPSHSPASNQGDWSYGDSYSSKSRRSHSKSANSKDVSSGGKIVDSTPRSQGGSRSASRGSRDRRRGNSGRGQNRHDEGTHDERGGTIYRHLTFNLEQTKLTKLTLPSIPDDHSYSSNSSSSSSSLSSSSSSSLDSEGSKDSRKKGIGKPQNAAESAFTKDQRTVFVSQLVMRTTERDILRYFKKKVGCKVNQVILLRDRRSRTHKGCAYVEFARIEDIAAAVGVSGQPPDFQRFPILIKPSEAEKNYTVPASTSTVTAPMTRTTTNHTPFVDMNGKRVEAQKVYVGGLDASVREDHLFALFSQFGQLDKVSMQMDPSTNISRGYAFLSYRDPKDANLAIQTMAGQVIAGRPMKTGWANQASSFPGVPIVTSNEFPEDGSARAHKAFQVLGQLMGGPSEAAINAMALSATAEKAINDALGMAALPAAQASETSVGVSEHVGSHSASSVPTVAEARASMQASVGAHKSAVAVADVTAALAPATVSQSIGGIDSPTRHILIYNMYDKDEETDLGWEKDIQEEFVEEASKFGKVERVVVMHKEPGGKIYASFEKVGDAEACANNLAGRWFDKRQLRVDFVVEKDVPSTETPLSS